MLCLFFVISRGCFLFPFFFQAEDGIRDLYVTGVQTCALPICHSSCFRSCGVQDSPAAAAPAALAKGRASVAAAPKRIRENGFRFSFGIADITFISAVSFELNRLPAARTFAREAFDSVARLRPAARDKPAAAQASGADRVSASPRGRTHNRAMGSLWIVVAVS